MTGQTPRLSLLAVGVLGLLAVLLCRDERAGERRFASAPAGFPSAAIDIVSARRSTQARPQAFRPVSIRSPKRLDPGLQDLADEVRRLRSMARYPKWSQPLDLIGDPIASAESFVPRSNSPDPQGEPHLVVYADHSSFDAPQPVVVHAYVATDGHRIAAPSIEGTVFDGNGSRVTELTFESEKHEGERGDDEPGYAASFTPGESDRANDAYSVRVRATTDEGEQRAAEISVIYNQPYVQLTGRYRDWAEDGNLVIEAELDVRKSASYRLQGSLYSRDGHVPIAWASVTAQLSPGSAWMELAFYGLILRERRAKGPFLLRFVSVTTETPDSEATTRAVDDAYVTRAYGLAEFTREAVNDPEVLAEAATLQKRFDRLMRAGAE